MPPENSLKDPDMIMSPVQITLFRSVRCLQVSMLAAALLALVFPLFSNIFVDGPPADGPRGRLCFADYDVTPKHCLHNHEPRGCSPPRGQGDCMCLCHWQVTHAASSHVSSALVMYARCQCVDVVMWLGWYAYGWTRLCVRVPAVVSVSVGGLLRHILVRVYACVCMCKQLSTLLFVSLSFDCERTSEDQRVHVNYRVLEHLESH